MKYDLTLKIFGKVFASCIKKEINNKYEMKAIHQEYKTIMCRAKDIGSKNNLLTSYALAAWFIAMNRSGTLTAIENFEILRDGMKNSQLIKLFMGDSKHYYSEKKMIKRREWSKQTHEKKYENDWVVDVIEDDINYDLGFDYLECGVCKLCRDEKRPDLAPYLCKLDYMLADMMGLNLTRTTTLAEGGDKCDFRYKK